MIPKILHRIWVGSELPTEFAAYGETWRTHHPGWEHILWTDETLPDVLSPAGASLYGRAAEYAPANVGQFKADIGRYELLRQFGGVYVDTDFECFKPLDELIEFEGCFAAWETPGKWIGNAIMGAEPEHPFLNKLVARLPANVRAMRGQRPNRMTGPQFLTRLYWGSTWRMKVFPKNLFYPYLYNELERRNEAFPDAFAAHHWNNARRRLVTA